MFNIKCIPCQVSTKDQDKERIASVEVSKVKYWWCIASIITLFCLGGGGQICPHHHVFAYTRVCMHIHVPIFCDFFSF